MQRSLPARSLVAALSLAAAPAAFADAASCTPAQEFAPGVISSPDLFESRLTFTPDRNTAYWSATSEPAPPGSDIIAAVLTSTRTAGGWSAPEIASFSGVHNDNDPHVSPDGGTMAFTSSRPGGVAPGSVLNDVWIAERTASGWSVPVNAGANVNSEANELYPSMDLWGNLFFASDRDRGRWDLYRAQRRPDGSYAPAVKLPRTVNHPNRWEFNPEISPNGQILFFATFGRPDSHGDVDIYVSRLRNGEWDEPRNLGPCVNTAAPEFHPTVLWDREEIYFVRVGATSDFYTGPLVLPR